MIQFDLPQEQSSIIKVVGVGGGGGNAVNHMFSQHINGVDFIICNTDAQALTNTGIPNRIQLGPLLTSGLGAGANPEIGRQATEESLEEIRKILEVNTKMAFITAGMGGGTGTGGAPIIAKICRDLGVLTVGIVTTPFAYEGKKRYQQAEDGIKQLRQYVDTLLVINNDKLRHQFGNLKMREAFEKADNVLATAAKCITDVINSTGQINVDFADVCTVMRNGGRAVLGSATASGEDRAQRAIEEALSSPLLNDDDIRGAKWILININSAEGESEFTMDEVEVIQAYLISQAGEDADVILGLGYDNSLGENIGITIIATGFENKDIFIKPVLKKGEAEEGKIVMALNSSKPEEQPQATAPVAVPEATAPTPPQQEVKEDVMAPKLVEEPAFWDVPMPTAADAPSLIEVEEEPAYFNLMAEAVLPVAGELRQEVKNTPQELDVQQAFYSNPVPPSERVISQPAVQKEEEQQQSETLAGKSFLAKPENIYAELKEEKPAVQDAAHEEEAQMELQERVVQEVSETVQPAEMPSLPTSSVDTVGEEDLQRRKIAERLQKLRNLSFNANYSDPNSELEHVPAYIRRNLELHNNTSHVESYYSKYEVSSDDENQGQINTINTFLDGKKPD
ncbi:MAG: cell division protein FtsZ [Niabella sp.]